MSERKPNGYWTFDRCKEDALKYKHRTEFSKLSSGAYNSAKKHKWLDDICSHMMVLNDNQKRCIYAYEFSDNCVYVGLTFNIDNRHQHHLNEEKSQVYKHINETKTTFIHKQLNDYLEVNDAIKMEEYYVNLYKENGWDILNVAKTGSIGAVNKYWTIEKCQTEALKYKYMKDFREKSSEAYNAVIKNNWINDINKKLIYIKRPNNYWTFEKCKEEALKYETRTEFIKNSNGAYDKAHRKDWLNDICSHMIKKKKSI